jgi:hypothetical protein
MGGMILCNYLLMLSLLFLLILTQMQCLSFEMAAIRHYQARQQEFLHLEEAALDLVRSRIWSLACQIRESSYRFAFLPTMANYSKIFDIDF